ncbi:ferritin [Ornithinimicrobium humiphilum]|uniref:Ferritin n=1 Tax=Ornithinimicrobium humiphilum TaxID=125288 RepID=A0A543K7N6_9MICO|nr:ferritin [Ornithinimicrobium humiphilum]TQM91101.1 ferritin [Ornithinimicrobium humiphilum]
MKLSESLLQAFSDQITLELQSSIVYLQLAIALDDHNLPGMANWMRVQSDEERLHALRFITHVTDRGGRPMIGAMTAPGDVGRTVLEAFRTSLEHEEKVSESIRSLYRAVQAEGDIDAIPLLNFFVEEQIEEEATVSEIVGRLEMIGDDGTGLLRLDSELATRQPPAAAGPGA